MNALINESQRLVAESRTARAALAKSYGWELEDNMPTPTFVAARREAEAATDSRLVKFFTVAQERITALMPPANILIMTERRLLLLPEPLLSQVQACEKQYSAGRWYVSVPAQLWQSITRLLGAGSFQQQEPTR